MNKTYSIALLSIATLGSGCASIVSGQNQSVSVETRAKQGASIIGANCKLTNDKGTWFVTSPGSVSVRRSYEDMAIKCEKAELEPGVASVKSSTKGMAFGNILFGGVIGAGVDVASGAAYDYPTVFTVMMGDKLIPDTPVATTPPAPQPVVVDSATQPPAPAAPTIQVQTAIVPAATEQAVSTPAAQP